jgi:ABC-2 type transport system ATP-binding protein
VTAIIEAEGLTKSFGRVRALDGIDLRAESGQVLAVLGPNGAGKTTFVRAIATLLRPDGGELHVAGYDVRREPGRVRSAISLAGQSAAVEPAMTGRENVEMVARLVGTSRRDARAEADAILEQIGLADAARRLVRTYSGGMRRRLDLGASLVGRPRLLLLDEPTTGLDPRSRIDLWDAIRTLVGRGTDVLLTTQYLDEADHLADRIAIVDHGRVIASGTPRELKRRVGNDVVDAQVRESSDVGVLADVLAPVGVEPPVVDAALRRVSVAVEDGTAGLRAAITAVEQRGLAVDGIGLRAPTLDEVFLALTGAPGSSDEPDPPDAPVPVAARAATH